MSCSADSKFLSQELPPRCVLLSHLFLFLRHIPIFSQGMEGRWLVIGLGVKEVARPAQLQV